MSQPDEHLIAAAPGSIREPAPGFPPKHDDSPAARPAARYSYNPFRLLVPKTGPWQTLAHYVGMGANICAFIFWLIGMAISIYLLIIAGERTWVDWLLRPIFFPALLTMLGEVVGGLIGLLAWIGHQIFHVHE